MVRALLETAIFNALTSAAGTVLWGQRVYNQQAPQGAVRPFVLFFQVAGGDLNVSPSRMVDVVYQVEVAAEVQADARNGADYLEAALHDQALTVSGWTHIATTLTDYRTRLMNHEGKQYWRAGGDYRIRLAK